MNVSFAVSQTGKELFIEKRCSRCHTIGRGRFVGPDLYNISKKYNKEQVTAWVVNPEIVYSQTSKKPYNDGYPPMPQLGVNDHDAGLIANFLFNNDIKKQEKDKGIVEGILINESTGTGAEGNDIYLKSFIGDRLTDEKLQITDTNGKFKFKNLSWVNSYSIKIKHDGLEYETAKMVFPPDKDKIELNLPLFETTENDSKIFLRLNHEILTIGEKTVSIAEIYDFENMGSKIFIGKPGNDNIRQTLKFYVPENGINLSFIEGIDNQNVKRENNILYDSSGFPPGRKRVVLTYDIPLEYGKNTIKKEILFNLSTLLLLVDDKKELVKVSLLTELEPVTIENKKYLRWAGDNLKTGSKYNITITNRSVTLKYLDIYPIIIFAALFLSALIIGFITKSERSHIKDEYHLKSKREDIIQKIIKLDEKYEEHLISDSEYTRKRNELKNYIVDIDNQLSGFKDHQNDTE